MLLEVTQLAAVAEVLAEVLVLEQMMDEAEATVVAELDLDVLVNITVLEQLAHKAP